MISRTSPEDRCRSLLVCCSLVMMMLVPSADPVQAGVEAPVPGGQALLVEQLEAGVESLGDVDATQRATMLRNLRGFLEAGLEPNRLVGLFPAGVQPHLPGPEASDAQALVQATLAAGLPVDLMLTKIQEGCRKRVPPARIVEATRRMGDALGQAAGFLADATRDGVGRQAGIVPGLVGNVALNLWGGLGGDDLAQLRHRAAERPGGCTLEELVAATDCAASLITAGATSGDAVDIAAQALGRHLSPREMREMTALVRAANAKAPFDDVLTVVRARLGDGLGPHGIAEQMVRAGWLGPGEVPGAHGDSGPSAGPGSPGYPGGAGSDSRTGNTRVGGGSQ